MAVATLYLYWGKSSPELFRWFVSQDGSTTQSGESSLQRLADQYSALQTTLLVPTEDLLITDVTIPTNRSQKVRQAVPYALEEQLIDDVELLHYAIGSLNDDGSRTVIAVKQTKMVEWLQSFDDSGLRLTHLLPDLFSLPQVENGWTLHVESERALLRTGEQQGYALPVEGLDALINSELASLNRDNGVAPDKIVLIDCRSEGAQNNELLFELPFESLPCLEKGGEQIANSLNSAPALNLLQGDFSRSVQIWRHLKPWRAAAAMVLSVMLLQGVSSMIELQRLQTVDAQLQADIENLYRDTFPNARKIINPRLQME
ncbi:MAG: type II secretion system protein GspL, partial [Gammaproteobacteria bacterium]|nr:type II secretion system protein GspL [Gammaproteobacteria bacterium]